MKEQVFFILCSQFPSKKPNFYFLFLQVKEKVSTRNVNFSKAEGRVVMKYLFLKRKTSKEIHTDMLATLGEQRPCNSTIKSWVAKFKTGFFDIAVALTFWVFIFLSIAM